MGRNLNSDSPICLDISAEFANIHHLLNCTDRHFFKYISLPKEPQFNANTQCLVQVLHAVSPISFEVRIHKCKDLNGAWWDSKSALQFDQFSEDLNEFQRKFFVPVEIISDGNKNKLFALRKGEQFSRCIILQNK